MKNGKTLLVVDDNADDSFLLLRLLREMDPQVKVKVITDGQRALDYLLENECSPSALFLDLWLPSLKGLQLLAEIKKYSKLRTMPIFIMTGSVDPGDEKECGRFGVAGFCRKPLSRGEVAEIFAQIKTSEEDSGRLDSSFPTSLSSLKA